MAFRHTYNNTYDPIHCAFYDYHPCPTLLLAAGSNFFIKKIEFFSSAEDAEQSRNGTVIDLSSKKAAKSTLFLDQDPPTGLFGSYEFDDDEHALSLKQSDSNGHMADFGSRVKFPLRMKNTHILTNDQSFVTITYKTNIRADSMKICLMAENFRGKCLTLEPDVSASGGEYITTKPVNIHVFDQQQDDFFVRLLTKRNKASDFTNGILLYLAPGDNSMAHAHPQIELLYNKGDTITVFVHTLKCTMKHGDIIIVPSMCAHSIASKENTVSLCSIKFQPEYLYAYGVPHNTMRNFIASWQEQVRYSPLFKAEELREIGLDKIIEELILNLKSTALTKHIKTHAKLLTIFSIMMERFNSDITEQFNTNAMTAPFERVIQEAQRNLSDFTVSDAAKCCNLSFNYFCSRFKKAYGMSFSAYLYYLRMNEAKRLLLTTEMSITDIAMATGFTDASYFIKKFKLTYNLTPHQFRHSTQYVDEYST